jgi:hypothetical protein
LDESDTECWPEANDLRCRCIGFSRLSRLIAFPDDVGSYAFASRERRKRASSWTRREARILLRAFITAARNASRSARAKKHPSPVAPAEVARRAIGRLRRVTSAGVNTQRSRRRVVLGGPGRGRRARSAEAARASRDFNCGRGLGGRPAIAEGEFRRARGAGAVNPLCDLVRTAVATSPRPVPAECDRCAITVNNRVVPRLAKTVAGDGAQDGCKIGKNTEKF